MAETSFDAVAGSLNSKTVLEIDNSSNKSVPSRSFFSLGSVTLSPGVYLIYYGGCFDVDMGSTMTVFALNTDNPYTNEGLIAGSLIRSTGSNGGGDNGMVIYRAEQQVNVHFFVYSNYGSAAPMKAGLYDMKAVKIGA